MQNRSSEPRSPNQQESSLPQYVEELPFEHTDQSQIAGLAPEVLKPGTTTLKSLTDLKTCLFTENELKSILRNTPDIEDFQVDKYQLFSLSGQVEGFLGVHYKLVINYRDTSGAQKQHYFLKLLSGVPNITLKIVLSLNAYEKERFFYRFLLPEFDRHEIDISFSPRGYFFKEYLAVLEDMSFSDYRNTSKIEFFDLNHCRKALNALAKFHASGILYELMQSKESKTPFCLAEEHPDMFKEMIFTENANKYAKRWFTYSVKGLLQIAKLISARGFRQKDFTKKLTKFTENCNNIYNCDKYKRTILHGDLWSSNFLFKYEKDLSPVDCVLVDYQLVKYGPPALDVLHVMYCNTRKTFRDNHLTELLRYYHKCLRTYLLNYNIQEILPKDEFHQSCKDLQCLIKLQCICDRCVTNVPDEILKNCVGSGTDEDMEKYLFEGRPEAIEACFRETGLFKDLLTEDILELRDLLNETQC